MHEIAHTLGVPHERTDWSLMNPRYRVTASGFSDEAARIVRASLHEREHDSSAFMDSAFVNVLSTTLSAPDAEWEPSSRDQVLGQVASYRASAPQPTSESASPPASPLVAGLSAAEQATYDRARAELAAGRPQSARSLALPLISKHGDLPMVQDLRCNIAMAAGADPEQLSAECAAFSAFGAK